MNAVHNEQTKLLATAVGNVAVAFVVIGFVTPITAASFSVTGITPLRSDTAAFILVWLFAGAGLHLIARRILRGSKP